MPKAVAANYMAVCQRRHTDNSIIIIVYEVSYRRFYNRPNVLIDLLFKSMGDRDHLATSRHVQILRCVLFERICL